MSLDRPCQQRPGGVERNRRQCLWRCSRSWAWRCSLVSALAALLSRRALSPKCSAAKLLPHGWIDAHSLREADTVVVWLIRAPRVLVARPRRGRTGAGWRADPGVVQKSAGLADVLGTSHRGCFWCGAGDCLRPGHTFASVRAVAGFSRCTDGPGRGLYDCHAAWPHPCRDVVAGRHGPECLAWGSDVLVLSLQFVSYQVAQEILFWLMGGLDSRTWTHVAIVAVWPALPSSRLP